MCVKTSPLALFVVTQNILFFIRRSPLFFSLLSCLCDICFSMIWCIIPLSRLRKVASTFGFRPGRFFKLKIGRPLAKIWLFKKSAKFSTFFSVDRFSRPVRHFVTCKKKMRLTIRNYKFVQNLAKIWPFENGGQIF